MKPVILPIILSIIAAAATEEIGQIRPRKLSSKSESSNSHGYEGDGWIIKASKSTSALEEISTGNQVREAPLHHPPANQERAKVDTATGDHTVTAGPLESQERAARADGDHTVAAGPLESQERVVQVDGDHTAAAGPLESQARAVQADGDHIVTAGPLESQARAAVAVVTAGRAVAVVVAAAEAAVASLVSVTGN